LTMFHIELKHGSMIFVISSIDLVGKEQ
jgi:hypothetical protein